LARGHLVLCCSSDVTPAGPLRVVPLLHKRIVALSSGRSLRAIGACLKRYVNRVPDCVELPDAVSPYQQAATGDSPFPSHPHYDLKAWQLLLAELNRYTEPVLSCHFGA